MGNSNKFLDGFLWGLLIGGTAVFLFGTKKGNKILKTITQEGTQGLNNVLSDLEEAVGETEEENLSGQESSYKEEANTFSDNHFQDISKIKEKPVRPAQGEPKSRRFFKSSKKQ